MAGAAGLRHVDAAQVAFRHPLLRPAVDRAATFRQRQAVPLALASAVDGDRRAWHPPASEPVGLVLALGAFRVGDRYLI